MPHFCYEARDPQGRLVKGRANGPGHLDVVLELKKVGYDVVRVWHKPLYMPGGRLWSLFGQVPLSELSLFTREMAMFFSAGIGLDRGLSAIQEQGFSKQTSQAAGDVAKGLSQGRSLSQSMSLRPDVFRRMYVKMVKAGEESGALEHILRRLADYLEKELVLTRRIQSALAYPGLIFFLCIGLTAFLVFFLFPIFVSFFDGLDIRLPWITTSLVALTRMMRHPVAILIMILSPFLFGKLLGALARSESVVEWYSQTLLRIPLIGRLKKTVVLTRFCSTLSILLNAGIPQFSALNITSGALGSRTAESAITRAAIRIRDQGDSLSEALGKEELFPPLLVSLVLVGEEVGDLPRVLDLASAGFEMDVETTVSRLTVFLEPLMLTIMGFVVGYVLLAVFLPIYSMLDGL